MKKPILFKEYIWLLNTIRRAGKISFEELNEKWLDTDMSEGMPLTKATFARHRIAIEDIFGIIIECQRQGGYLYYLSNPKALQNDSVQNWMLSTLSVSNVISESAGLKDRIMLEPVADDNGYLQMVIDAMKKGVRIAIVYNRYGGYDPRNLNFEPYALKMWHQRWYVLGHFHRDATEDKKEVSYFGIFSFDRIRSMELTDIKFTIDPDFSAQEFFSECFGVVQGDEYPTERVVLRAYDMERYYIILYAKQGYQSRNKDTGGGSGKKEIGGRKPPKTYSEGKLEGKRQLCMEICRLIEDHLDISIRPGQENSKKAQNAFRKFHNLIDPYNYWVKK